MRAAWYAHTAERPSRARRITPGRVQVQTRTARRVEVAPLVEPDMSTHTIPTAAPGSELVFERYPDDH